MPIRIEMDEKGLEKIINMQVKASEELILEALRKTCIDIVTMAKAKTDTYIDDTNNLRSSIGFAIYNNGQKTDERFFKSGTGTGTRRVKKGEEAKPSDGKEGIETGKRIADEIAKGYPKGMVAVVVAGMPYAYEVEHEHNKDVLTGSWLQFDRVFKDILREFLR
ncbi:MAG: hypothetical protein LBI60_03610 [Bacteroidales bacterium]|jgi:hypothetical protein|nr:hypothetical protein [Bacteroidales bacterium]